MATLQELQAEPAGSLLLPVVVRDGEAVGVSADGPEGSGAPDARLQALPSFLQNLPPGGRFSYRFTAPGDFRRLLTSAPEFAGSIRVLAETPVPETTPMFTPVPGAPTATLERVTHFHK